jgi:hypothetical protein
VKRASPFSIVGVDPSRILEPIGQSAVYRTVETIDL